MKRVRENLVAAKTAEKAKEEPISPLYATRTMDDYADKNTMLATARADWKKAHPAQAGRA